MSEVVNVPMINYVVHASVRFWLQVPKMKLSVQVPKMQAGWTGITLLDFSNNV